LLFDAVVGGWLLNSDGTVQSVEHHDERDALLGLPKMWRKRQAIQSTRIATVREIWRVMDKRLLH